MVQLLNRFAWVISLTGGLSLFSIFGGGELFIFGIIAGVVIKGLFFSKIYIETRVDFFATHLSKRFNVGDETVTASIKEPQVPSDAQAMEYSPEDSTKMTEFRYEDDDSKEEIDEYTPYKSAAASQESAAQDDELKYQFQASDAISKFFSENLLAKLGGILVFLGVFFFLALIYTIVAPVTKMLIGFAIGGATFFGGVWLDKKGYTNESRIVMGTAILINYLVILGGRHLLGGASEAGTLLPVGITFLFLILNTLFAITTSLVYKSHTLLIFSFVFAYINPLLLGTSSEGPYTLLGYTMIVTLGAMFMSYTRKDIILFVLSFIFAAILFLSAPYGDANGWISKLLCVNVLGAVSLYVSTIFEKKYQYLNELLIGGSFFLIGLLGLLDITHLSVVQLAILGFSSLALMFFSYASSDRGAYLYSIGTLGSILILTPALIISGVDATHIGVSSLIIATFTLLHIGFLLVKNTRLIAENIGNILAGLISGAIFMTYLIYVYGNIYFQGMMQGFVFFTLAVLYVCTAFFLVQKIGLENMRSQEKYRNIFYALSALAISLFSLAVAFVFANKAEIIALIWILESTILFYFARKLASARITLAALILHSIGVLRLLPFLEMDMNHNYGLLVSIALIVAALMGNLFLLMRSKDEQGKNIFSIETYVLHHVFHILGMIVSTVFLVQIFDINDEWTLLLLISVILAILGYVYTLAGSRGLQKVHMLAYLGALMIHIGMFLDDMGGSSLNLGLSTLIVGIYALPFIGEYIQTKKLKNLGLFAAFLGYIFVLSTLYISHIFDSTFAVTLYWGVLSFGLLSYGIQKDIIQLRTIGLYLICLTAGKIFFSDIWIGMNNTIERVAALMVVGILMIILSTMYTKKYGNTLNKEFNLENLFPKTPQISQKDSPKSTQKTEKNTIQKDIEDMQLDPDIVGVRMYVHGAQKPIQIRATNLIKVAKLIETTLHKTEFAAGELSQLHSIITQNYKSSLSPDQYKKIQEIVSEFVEKGGKMEFVRK